ncbi:NUDIX domain-containing protein [Nocardioides iriomotensis]|uniref:NUDIX domain-containing protein n=2 Tax=Nocardioides iriomotensis TaxID=715784 RepID=A0A4Q5J629_9ACTN|nr:NUDIX domain-containing protein [Nocardioides iriomotensis]
MKRHYRGEDYAVLPGGGVDEGESQEAAAVRELLEETTLRGSVAGVLLSGTHNGRPATYFLLADVTGEPVLSGPEADAQAEDNRFELVWAAAADLERLGLHPPHLRDDLPRLLGLT